MNVRLILNEIVREVAVEVVFFYSCDHETHQKFFVSKTCDLYLEKFDDVLENFVEILEKFVEIL